VPMHFILGLYEKPKGTEEIISGSP